MATGTTRWSTETSDSVVEAAAAAQSLEDLAGILRDLRRRHARSRRDSSLTYRELAALTGWSQAAIAQYFTARTLAPTDRFDALLEVLGAGPAEMRTLAEARDRVEENQRRARAHRSPSTLVASSPSPDTVGLGAARQLPPDTALFTGRDGELGQLLALAERARFGPVPGAAVISAIDGMGGVGKTALAIHAGHRLAEHFPDGQLFLDLCGFAEDEPPREPTEALAELLTSLGVEPGRMPAQPDALAALYRDRLAGTRTLVVLDNAYDEDQVRALLPASSECLVLITSRRRLKALDDALHVPLDVLEQEEAVTLLRRAARWDPNAGSDGRWDEVAKLCGRLPLALLIAGALLRVGGNAWNLERLIDRLASRRPGGELAGYTDETRSLTALFDLSLRALPAGERLLYRRLGLAPTTEIDTYAAAALLGSDPDTAERRLERLADHSLLRGVLPGRYRMHDLLHACARDRAVATDPQPEREAAVERLLQYWAHTAQAASVHIAEMPRSVPSGPAPVHAPAIATPDAARAWLRTERANLEAAFDSARGRDGHTIALAAGLAEILCLDGPWPRAMEISQAAAQAAERSGRRAAQAAALADLGWVRHLTGDYPGAVEAHTRALEIHRDLGDCVGEANALSDLGSVKRATGDYPGATEAKIQALKTYRNLDNRAGEAYTLVDLGRLQQLIGDFPRATQSLSEAMGVLRSLGDRAGEAYALYALGRVCYATGDYTGAVDAHDLALKINRDLGKRLGEANVLTELGRVRHATGDYAESGHVLTRSLELYRALGNRLGEAQALTELGRVRHATGGHIEAGHVLTRAMEIYREIGDRADEAVAINYYAATLAATGHHERAFTHYCQALATHRELHKPDDEAVSLEGIAEYCSVTGDTAGAAAHLRQALEIYERLGMAPDTLRVRSGLLTMGF